MIDHVTLRVHDLAAAKAFYVTALKPLGYQVLMDFPEAVGLGAGGKADLWLAEDRTASPQHLAFVASSRPLVDAFHAAGLAAGGRDNGAPGLRAHYHPNYYGAFVDDPTGHHLEAVIHAPPGAAKGSRKAAKPAARKGAPRKSAAKPAARRPARKATRKAARRSRR